MILMCLLAVVASAACDMGAPKEDALHTGPSEILKGTYETEISALDLAGHDISKEDAGRWTLSFDKNFYRLESDGFFRVTEEYWTEGSDWYAEGVAAPEGAFVCKLLGRPQYAGSSYSVGIYSIEKTKHSIEFVAEDDPCDLRVFLLERTWEKTENPGGDRHHSD